MKRTFYSLNILLLLLMTAGCAPKEKFVTLQNIPKDAPVKKITMTAEKYRFTPETITTKKGTRLVLEIESLDVTHEFKLKGYDIYARLPAGKKVVVDIYASRTGEFDFGCHIGLGIHYSKGMKGTLIVTE